MGSPNAAVPQADPAASPAAAAGNGTDGAAVSGSPPAGSGAPSPGAAAESPNIRQLREAYEKLKGEYEPYSKLGKPEEIQTHVSIAQKLASESVEIGTRLGYEETEIRQALANDPAGTIAFLRQKAAEAEKTGAQPDPQTLIKQMLDKELKPFRQAQEQQMIEKANGLFDTAFEAETKKLFADEAIPTEERSVLYDVASQMMSYDEKALQRLKFEGKTSDVAKYVNEARAFLDKYYLARSGRESKRIGGKTPGSQQPGAAKDNGGMLSIGQSAKDFVKNLM